MARDNAQVEVTQLKSLEAQLSEDSPLENFIRLTEDMGETGWVCWFRLGVSMTWYSISELYL